LEEIYGAPRSKIVVLVRDPVRHTQSYTWRIWRGGTSFYIKPRWGPVSAAKVSLHGPRNGAPGLWKIGVDWRDRDRAVASGGAVLYKGDTFRAEFVGQRVAPGVRWAVRIRNPWTGFHRGVPSGPHPGPVRDRDSREGFYGVIKPPQQMHYVDVDVYVSDDAPYWPDLERLRRDNARVGWLVNDAGQHLTAISRHQGLKYLTPPAVGRLPSPTGPDDITRAISGKVFNEVLWLEEQIASRQVFATDAG
jgi:hypothetical protein